MSDLSRICDGLTSQNVMPVYGEGLPGKALKKDGT